MTARAESLQRDFRRSQILNSEPHELGDGDLVVSAAPLERTG